MDQCGDMGRDDGRAGARHLSTDVLVIGAGGAGMYAALEAARNGAKVVLADRSLIGRGGATIMAQMTVAVALGDQEPDHWEHHYADTLAAGRGLCDPALARLLCEEGPDVIREMDEWGVGWARQDGSRRGPMKQAFAPGHDRPRCVYVDFLNTGPAVSKTLRTRLIRTPGIRRIGDLLVSDLSLHDGNCVGAVALHLATGQPVTISAAATVVATGGLTRLYQRNSASANMSGDGYALCLAAGAELVDMEFVQFFPIGHLAPRLIGMDPIMWDPFRYKLGGRLLNGNREEFVHKYGAWLSFEHCSESDLRAAGGPVIDRLAKNGIDLTRQAIEVAPIAHYHMGGVKADASMATRVPGLFAAGEAVGGANGANRLSGNAITEALVFGRKAGSSAAAFAHAAGESRAGKGVFGEWVVKLERGAATRSLNPAAMIEELQGLMQKQVGPFRTGAGLERALMRIASMHEALAAMKPPAGKPYDTELADWLDLSTMLTVARSVAFSALNRTESRGAHQREDFPGMDPAWQKNQVIA